MSTGACACLALGLGACLGALLPLPCKALSVVLAALAWALEALASLALSACTWPGALPLLACKVLSVVLAVLALTLEPSPALTIGACAWPGAAVLPSDMVWLRTITISLACEGPLLPAVLSVDGLTISVLATLTELFPGVLNCDFARVNCS